MKLHWCIARRNDVWTWLKMAALLSVWGVACRIVPGPEGAVLPGLPLPYCLLRSWTGIPCPLCGLTTGCAWMARGNLIEAWRSSLLSPFLMAGSAAAFLYLGAARLVAGRRVEWEISAGSRRALVYLFWGLMALSWAKNLLVFLR